MSLTKDAYKAARAATEAASVKKSAINQGIIDGTYEYPDGFPSLEVKTGVGDSNKEVLAINLSAPDKLTELPNYIMLGGSQSYLLTLTGLRDFIATLNKENLAGTLELFDQRIAGCKKYCAQQAEQAESSSIRFQRRRNWRK